jgi:NADPH-dependent curcumin reductase CurA
MNTRIVLSRRPNGVATPDCFSVETETLAPLEPGQVRVAVVHLRGCGYPRDEIDAGPLAQLQGASITYRVAVRLTASFVFTRPRRRQKQNWLS